MRVNPSGNNASIEQLRSSTDSNRSSGKTTSTNSTGSDADVFSRSSDLNRLVSSLKEVPEIRSEVLAAVQTKIAAGELNQQSAFAEAAAAIDDSNNG